MTNFDPSVERNTIKSTFVLQKSNFAGMPIAHHQCPKAIRFEINNSTSLTFTEDFLKRILKMAKKAKRQYRRYVEGSEVII